MPEPRLSKASVFTRYSAAALLVLALPAALVAHAMSSAAQGTAVSTQASNITINSDHLDPRLVFSTPFNRIKKVNLTGAGNLTPGDPVYVFLSPGPKQIWYPFAAAKRPPQGGCGAQTCLLLKGRVTGADANYLDIEYGFETAYISRTQLADIKQDTIPRGELILSVGKSGQAMIKTLQAGEIAVSQPALPMKTLDGLMSLGASKAPAKNPPM